MKIYLWLLVSGVVMVLSLDGYGQTIVINELMYDAPSNIGDTNGEWIELYNYGTQSIDISNWEIDDDGISNRKIPAMTTIPAGGYIVLIESTTSFTSSSYGYDLDDVNYVDVITLVLDDNNGTLTLKDSMGATITTLTYSHSYGTATSNSGKTLEKIDPIEDDNDSNWGSSIAIYGTPGKRNSICYQKTSLSIVPRSKLINKGDEFSTDIQIQDVKNLVAAQLHLLFDSNILDVLSLNPDSFFPSSTTVTASTITTSGQIYYFAGLTSGSINGSGTLCSINFKAKDVGTSTLIFGSNTTIIDAENKSISFDKNEGLYHVATLRESGTIAGLCLIDYGTGGQMAASITVQLVGTGATTTTNSNSYFIFTNIPVGTYTLAFSYPGATPATKTDIFITNSQIQDTTDTGTMTLIMGDPNGDAQINIADWPYLRDAFFSNINASNYNPNCDFNLDKEIDILDFMIFRDNFGKQQQQIYNARPLAVKSFEDITLKFEPNSIKKAKIGDIITLNILASEVMNVLCGEIHLTYDKDILSPIGIIGNWSTQIYEFINRVKDGKIDYAFGLRESETSNSTKCLASISFMVKKSGDTNISFDLDEKKNRKTMFIKDVNKEYLPINIRQEPINIQILANPDIICYPNPAKEIVTFKGISVNNEVTLRIYTVTGELVYEGQKTTNSQGELTYDLKNNKENRLASGLYIWLLDDGQNKKNGKIGIIR